MDHGSRVRVGQIAGMRGTGTVVDLAMDHVTLDVDLTEAPNPAPRVDLIVALPRPPALRRIFQTAATMGVRRIDLVNSLRVQKSYFQTPSLETDAIREQLILGAEQGVTTWLPEVHVHRDLQRYLEGIGSGDDAVGMRWVCDGSGRSAASTSWNEPALIAIGPEGGFVEPELVLFQKRGFQVVSLGPAALRCETAVAVVLGQLEVLKAQEADK